MGSHMVVSVVSPGQLGNKLFQYAYFLGNAMEYGGEVATLDFGSYQEHFEFSLTQPYGIYPLNANCYVLPKEFVRVLFRLVRLKGYLRLGKVTLLDIRRTFDDRKEHFQLADEPFCTFARETTVYAAGYYFRDIENLFKHREAIVEFLKPIERHRQAVAAHLKQFRGKRLVGIHIRHGDYAHYQGGRFFYSIDQYISFMQQVVDQSAEPVHFLIASNASISADAFSPFSVSLAPGDMVQDLFCLSECSLIIGPPSTYSLWASFQQLRPLIHVYDPALALDIGNARPIHRENAP